MIIEIHYLDTDIRQKFAIKKARCTIGRSVQADVRLELENFPNLNIELETDEKDYFLTDLDSTNGIFVNNERIPVGIKTLFKNFYPMQIGDKVSIYVYPEPQARTERTLSNFNLDKTSSLSRNPLASFESGIAKASRSEKETETKKEKEDTSKWAYIGLALMAIGIYYLYHGHQKKIHEKVHANNSSTAIETVASMEPTIDINTEELEKLNTENKCPELGGFCQNINLTRANEKMVMTKDKVILFVNYPAFISQMKATYLEKETPEDQAEYILAYYAYHPEIEKEAKMRDIPYIVVTGLDVADDLVRIKYAMIRDVSKNQSFNLEEHKSFFSNIFYGGIFRPYRTYLKPHLKFIKY